MSEISFPLNPSNNQVYTVNGRYWRWDGVSWNSIINTDYGNILFNNDGNIGTISTGTSGLVLISDGSGYYWGPGGGGSGFSGWSGQSGFSGWSGQSGFSGWSGQSGFSGWSGQSGFSGWSGFSGISGYSGLDGAAAASGYSGSSGWSGQSGFSGWSGQSGFSGWSGSGISGFSGWSGSGISGFSGWSGQSGFSGWSGQSGFSGFSGSGISGFSGWSGSGISGFSGWSGSGTSGFSGWSGQSGFSGWSGQSGFSGWSGQSGFSGWSGSGISGFSGWSGSGISGFSGWSGSGTSGFSGWSGQSGFSGWSGSGISGFSGWSGSGISGFSGFSGSGTSGFSGWSGQSGFSGWSGQSGFSGWSGSGISGFSGWSGSGISGFSGQSGFSGFSGYSGLDGAAAASGFSGFSGWSGQSGFSGWSGSGISGFSGWSGSGTSGFSGWSGSGISGFSGWSGSGISGFSGWSGSGISGFSGWSGSGISGFSGWSGSGISGFSGWSGSGISGFSGWSGSGISGFSGWSGSGISGFSGWSGSGISGFSGWSGSGISGFSGWSGSGISGFSGWSGSGISGFSGWSGSGISGFSGWSGSGISGFSGWSGRSGFSGWSGSGISGFSGFSGWSGRSGFSGWSGSGISGFSGFSGWSGRSGFSGFSGELGISGFSGWSGRSGFSGFSGTSQWTTSGSNIYYTTGSVGIGSTSFVNERLLVKGLNTTGPSVYDYINCSNEVDADFKVKVSGSSATDKRAVIGISTVGNLDFITNNLERVRIDSSGNMGIGTGTTSPGKKIDVEIGNTSDGVRVNSSTGSGSGGIAIYEGISYRVDSNQTFQTRYAGAFRRSDGTAIASGQGLGAMLFGGQHGIDTTYQSAKVLYPASIVGVAEGSFTSATAMPTGISFRTGNTGDSVTSVNVNYGTEAMRITANGNIGIGNSSPTYKLQVNGGVAGKGGAIGHHVDAYSGTDTQKIQAAINAALNNDNNSTVVVFGSREYNIASTISIPINNSTISLIGQGSASNPGFGIGSGQIRGTIINVDSGQSAFHFTSAFPLVEVSPGTWDEQKGSLCKITVRGLRFKGVNNGAITALKFGNAGGQLTGVGQNVVDDISIEGFAVGIDIINSRKFSFTDIMCRGSETTGSISVRIGVSAAPYFSTDMVFSRCEFSTSADSGAPKTYRAVELNACNGIHFTDCYFYDGGLASLYIKPTSPNVVGQTYVTACQFEGESYTTTTHAILVDGTGKTFDLNISRCWIESWGTAFAVTDLAAGSFDPNGANQIANIQNVVFVENNVSNQVYSSKFKGIERLVVSNNTMRNCGFFNDQSVTNCVFDISYCRGVTSVGNVHTSVQDISNIFVMYRVGQTKAVLLQCTSLHAMSGGYMTATYGTNNAFNDHASPSYSFYN